MTAAHTLDTLEHLLRNRPNLTPDQGSQLADQFAQPIFDHRQAQHDQALAEQQQQQGQLADLQSMLLGNAVDSGTLQPDQLQQYASGMGASPQQSNDLAGLLGGTASAPDVDPEDLQANATVIQNAVNGVPPLQIGTDNPGTGQPVPKAVVMSQVENMMRGQGKSPAAIQTVLAHLADGYRFP